MAALIALSAQLPSDKRTREKYEETHRRTVERNFDETISHRMGELQAMSMSERDRHNEISLPVNPDLVDTDSLDRTTTHTSTESRDAATSTLVQDTPPVTTNSASPRNIHCNTSTTTLEHDHLLLLPAMMQHELRRVASLSYFSSHSQAGDDDDTQSLLSRNSNDDFCSTNDLLSLWLMDHDNEKKESPSEVASSIANNTFTARNNKSRHDETTTNWLHQDDVLSHVVAFLGLSSLRSFSETARQPNAACYEYLHYKLQRAMTSNKTTQQQPSDHDTAAMARLAQMDRPYAEELLSQFTEKRCTNSSSNVQHSLLERLRHMLQQRDNNNNNNKPESHSLATPEPHHLAKVALLLTVLGGAAAAYSNAEPSAEALLHVMEQHAHELPNVLFKLGCFGSLMGAAAVQTSRQVATKTSASERDDGEGTSEATNLPREGDGILETEQNDDVTRSLNRASSNIQNSTNNSSLTIGIQELRRLLMERSALFRRMQAAYDNAMSSSKAVISHKSLTSSPSDCKAATELLEEPPITGGVSGSVGSYVRAIRQAKARIRMTLKKERKARFDALSVEDREQQARTFLDACRSDETIDIVKELIHSVDVDGFHMAGDGSETCALHAAAFYGATKVLEFLCSGIVEDKDGVNKAIATSSPLSETQANVGDARSDGGLCDVNRKDKNGWTAAHFCAGSNSVPALDVLSRYGSSLNVEAGNGYTPLQWAVRLQNEHIAEELRRRTGKDGNSWIMSGQPLTAIANRFLAMMPTQTVHE